MDYINTIDNIIIKMKTQMHSKGIFCLDQVFFQLNKFDPNSTGIMNKGRLEYLLSQLGIFLKTQEITELLKYLDVDNDCIKLEKFVGLLKCEIPPKTLTIMNNIFDALSKGNDTLNIETLINSLHIEEHPQYMLMGDDSLWATETVKASINAVVGDSNKTEMTRTEFLTFVGNIYWTIPHENLSHFNWKLPLLFGLK
jgi:Ca2+-binding EF-hand superfamily protein